MDELINKDWSWATCQDKYLEELSDSGLHAETSIHVRIDLVKRLSRYAIAKKVPLPVNTSKVLLNQFLSKRNLANVTRVVQKRYLVHFYNFLQDNFVVLENYADLLPTPKVYTKERVIPTDDEVRAVYKAIYSQDRPTLISRDLVIVDLLILPALRVSELARLKIGDIFVEQEELRVTRKGGNQQMLPLQEETLGHIEEMLSYRDSLTLEDPLLLTTNKRGGKYRAMSVRSIQKLINKYLLGNFDLNKRSYGPHLLRHTGGTMLAKNGTDIRTIQEIFNHKNIATTMIYQHTSKEQMANAIKGCSNFSKNR